MAEETITKESEKSEETVSDEALRLQETAEYFALSVREQQMKQLQDFIDCANEMTTTDYDETGYSLEYITLAGAFFSVETQVMLQGVRTCYVSDDEVSQQNAIWSLRVLLELCKLYPELMLSGEYPGGGIIAQVPIA